MNNLIGLKAEYEGCSLTDNKKVQGVIVNVDGYGTSIMLPNGRIITNPHVEYFTILDPENINKTNNQSFGLIGQNAKYNGKYCKILTEPKRHSYESWELNQRGKTLYTDFVWIIDEENHTHEVRFSKVQLKIY